MHRPRPSYFGTVALLVGLAVLPQAGPLAHDVGSRPATLEDIYGPTGDVFQAALTFLNFESDVVSAPISGYGWGIDDMVIQWREYRLDEDDTDCEAGGSCATIDLIMINLFEADGTVEVTVNDPTPYGSRCTITGRCTVSHATCIDDPECAPDGGVCEHLPCSAAEDCPEVAESCAASLNDCDGNRHYFDPGDDDDCDDDGVQDVVAVATSQAEVAGERLVLNREEGLGRYTGSFSVSPVIDAAGVLLIQQLGSSPPRVTVSYDDIDDGTGQLCANNVDPEQWGTVRDQTNIFVDTVSVLLATVELYDNGDGDGIPDDHETLEVIVTLHNLSDQDLEEVNVWLSSDDPYVDCVIDSLALAGSLSAKETLRVEDPMTFRVAGVERDSLEEELTVELRFGISALGVGGTDNELVATFDLDLDLSGGSAPETFFEGFESGFGSYTTMHIDAGHGGATTDGSDTDNSDGFRCQYSDPNWMNSNSYGSGPGNDCYLNPTGIADEFYWQTLSDRSYSGSSSLYFGIPLGDPLGFTTPLSQIEAVRMIDPVNIGWARVCSTTRTQVCSDDAECPFGESCVQVTPQLTFKHQISMIDSRTVNAPPGESADRGVVHAQLADSDGAPIGHWIKLYPFTNIYDQQGTDNYTNCLFDPTDDGNDEDSFFDPTDPDRRLGPSSTCFPEFSFVFQGDTFSPFDPENLGCCPHGGRDVDGPGLQGETGIGTWVEPVFDLSRFRGRRLRFRFMTTGLKAGSGQNYQTLFAPYNPDPGDDGWFIDDVQISDTLAAPATVAVDIKDNSELPGCGTICDSVVANLVSDAPDDRLGAPGQVVELDAVNSVVDRCIGGFPQFRFWTDGDGDTVFGGSADRLLRDWSINPRVLDAPRETTHYLVDLRCSSDPTCLDGRRLTVVVDCPAGDGPGGIFQTITAPDPDRLIWSEPADGTFASGDLATVESYATTTTAGIIGATSIDISGDLPPAGSGIWYLLKSGGPSGPYCNMATWISGGVWERPGRDLQLP